MEHINISLLSMISLVAPFILMAVSIYYASKRLSTEAFLLVAGSVIVFLTAVVFIFMPYLIQSRNMTVQLTSVYYGVAGFISFMGSALFAAGFFILVLKAVRQDENAAVKKR